MQALTDRLVDQLSAAGTTFLPLEVTKVRREQRSVVVEPDGERFDGVILAVPAPSAFSVLEPVLGETPLPPVARMKFASVAVVTLAFAAAAPMNSGPASPRQIPAGTPRQMPGATPRQTRAAPYRGRLDLDRVSGILVAPGSGLLMTACSFGSNKWPHWAAAGHDRHADLRRQGDRPVLDHPR